ncbi:hypothetical protein PSEUDO9AG_50182 [Pseudomonas sp. 9Ag]|uniref:Uncharacterized protein n=1 Tax=Stutzerimonas stutzeri TaxID=316 RepID=A0A5S5BDV8_STUST|nr:hypothetical protein A9A72_122273 [Stutzerimonas stutzeri]VXC85930.1 hypothetical protein PSEUDO9AG_50182 [Pseudomonas sp. 9Ag]
MSETAGFPAVFVSEPFALPDCFSAPLIPCNWLAFVHIQLMLTFVYSELQSDVSRVSAA